MTNNTVCCCFLLGDIFCGGEVSHDHNYSRYKHFLSAQAAGWCGGWAQAAWKCRCQKQCYLITSFCLGAREPHSSVAKTSGFPNSINCNVIVRIDIVRRWWSHDSLVTDWVAAITVLWWTGHKKFSAESNIRFSSPELGLQLHKWQWQRQKLFLLGTAVFEM